MIVAIDSLQLNAFFSDSNKVATANSFIWGIASELTGLAEEKQIEAKRKSFQIVSDQLYELLNFIKYDKEVVYHFYCPTAFSDQGANWLSNSSMISNPYNPRIKRNCGVIKDSINFTTKY